MKALTVQQPWADLIAQGRKDVENRTWKPDLAEGERFAIHASKGTIVCTVRLIEVTRNATSRWAMPGFWHWRLADVQRIEHGPHLRGRLGLWEWDATAINGGRKASMAIITLDSKIPPGTPVKAVGLKGTLTYAGRRRNEMTGEEWVEVFNQKCDRLRVPSGLVTLR